MARMSDEWERKEQEERSKAWYAILGLGALVAGAFVILSWLPNNPFNVPSELPGMSRLNSTALNGGAAPTLPVTGSVAQHIGAACQVSDIARVQSWREPLRAYNTADAITAFAERTRGFEVVGWNALSPSEDAGSDAGCVVTFTFRAGRSQRVAHWAVSADRQTVTAVDELARTVSVKPASGGRGRRRR